MHGRDAHPTGRKTHTIVNAEIWLRQTMLTVHTAECMQSQQWRTGMYAVMNTGIHDRQVGGVDIRLIAEMTIELDHEPRASLLAKRVTRDWQRMLMSHYYFIPTQIHLRQASC